jgi:hypothetical protein
MQEECASYCFLILVQYYSFSFSETLDTALILVFKIIFLL